MFRVIRPRRDSITNTHSLQHLKPPPRTSLHTSLSQPGERKPPVPTQTSSPHTNLQSPHKPPVPTQTDLYNTLQTALIYTYVTQRTATAHTLHIMSFFTVQKTICCNSTSNAPDDGVLPETCRAKNTLVKLRCCIKLAFQVISKGP